MVKTLTKIGTVLKKDDVGELLIVSYRFPINFFIRRHTLFFCPDLPGAAWYNIDEEAAEKCLQSAASALEAMAGLRAYYEDLPSRAVILDKR